MTYPGALGFKGLVEVFLVVTWMYICIVYANILNMGEFGLTREDLYNSHHVLLDFFYYIAYIA